MLWPGHSSDMLTWEPGRGAHPSRLPQGITATNLYNSSNTSASATPRWEGRKEGGSVIDVVIDWQPTDHSLEDVPVG